MQVFYPYSKYLVQKYGEKVYKLPINVDGTCPNRDGQLGVDGCYFCAGIGAGFESLSNQTPIKQQLLQNKEYIGKRYGAKKFIAYFQNFTATYTDTITLKNNLTQAVIVDIVCINISTRPDCISKNILHTINEVKNEHDIDICIELGLQTINYKTLSKINRGHDIAQFIDAVLNIKKYDFDVSAHVIIDFPYDDIEDVIQTSKVLSALKVDGVKIHSLYIAKNSVFAKKYAAGELELLDKNQYISRAIAFLKNLDPEIYVERLIGRVPKNHSVVANFNTSWWVIKEEIEKNMMEKDEYQGCKYNYLDGSALKTNFE